MGKEKALKDSISLFVFLLLIWGFYRLFFPTSPELEELILKPIIWLGAVAFFFKRGHLTLENLGITTKNLFPAIYLSLALGSLFAIEAIVTNFVKYGHLNFQANLGTLGIFTTLGISFATAISEEITFRGYIFTRLALVFKNEFTANLVTSILWTLIHIPVMIFVWKYNFATSVVYIFLTFVFGLGSTYLFSRTRNISSSILLHVLWEWPIMLFR